jgi:Ca2+-binding EF-hand superfamily protein
VGCSRFYIAYLRQEQFPYFLGFPKSLPQIGKEIFCDESCLADLQIKLFIVFGLKTYGMKLMEYGMPLLKMRMRMRKSGAVDEQVEGNAYDRAVKEREKKEREKRGLSVEESDTNERLPDDKYQAKQVVRTLSIIEQASLEPWDGVFDDFSQMVVQYGYIALFAPACSLAPVLALINNVTEIRSDAVKVCTMHQRPTWRSIPSIGAWEDVVSALAVAAVLVNSTMLCFVGTALTDGSQYQRESIRNRVRIPELWVYCLLMEHGVLLLRTALNAAAPTEPKWVEEAKDTLAFQQNRMDSQADDILDLRSDAFKQSKGTQKAREIFNKIDEDGSGSLDSEEIRKLCLMLGMPLEKGDLLSVMQEMDIDADGRISFEEFNDWWILNFEKNVYQLRDPKEVFRELDTDGSGVLEKKEVQILLQQLGMKKISKRDLGQLMADLDSDSDGVVTIDEFCFWWSKNGARKYTPARQPGPGDPSIEAQKQREEDRAVKLRQAADRRKENQRRREQGLPPIRHDDAPTVDASPRQPLAETTQQLTTVGGRAPSPAMPLPRPPPRPPPAHGGQHRVGPPSPVQTFEVEGSVTAWTDDGRGLLSPPPRSERQPVRENAPQEQLLYDDRVAAAAAAAAEARSHDRLAGPGAAAAAAGHPAHRVDGAAHHAGSPHEEYIRRGQGPHSRPAERMGLPAQQHDARGPSSASIPDSGGWDGGYDFTRHANPLVDSPRYEVTPRRRTSIERAAMTTRDRAAEEEGHHDALYQRIDGILIGRSSSGQEPSATGRQHSSSQYYQPSPTPQSNGDTWHHSASRYDDPDRHRDAMPNAGTLASWQGSSQPGSSYSTTRSSSRNLTLV